MRKIKGFTPVLVRLAFSPSTLSYSLHPPLIRGNFETSCHRCAYIGLKGWTAGKSTPRDVVEKLGLEIELEIREWTLTSTNIATTMISNPFTDTHIWNFKRKVDSKYINFLYAEEN